MIKINPPLLYKLFIGFILISIIIPVTHQIPFPFNLLGIIPLIFGIYVAITAKSLFKRTNTPMNPMAKPIYLHQNGFYKYSRNPMYLGIAIGLFGLAVLSGILLNILYAFAYILICNFTFVRKEESRLKEKFGEEFEQYKHKTRRWI